MGNHASPKIFRSLFLFGVCFHEFLDYRIGPQGTERLAAASETNSTLTSLHLDLIDITSLGLSHNKIGAHSMERLAAALHTNSTLTSLDLSYNCCIDAQSAKRLAADLGCNRLLGDALKYSFFARTHKTCFKQVVSRI